MPDRPTTATPHHPQSSDRTQLRPVAGTTSTDHWPRKETSGTRTRDFRPCRSQQVKTGLMARATLHRFTRDTSTWKDAGTKDVHVSPALWVLVSALATKRPQGRPSVLTTVTETALLLQHLNHGPGRPLSWTRAALTAPPHLRRFLTESAALALTLQMAYARGWDPLRHHLLNVDDLPQQMHWLSPDSGPKPDFVYQTDHGCQAAEARGRSSERPVSTCPNQVQKTKIDKLDEWAKTVRKSGPSIPWSMTWAWMTDVATHIDMFRPPAPLSRKSNTRMASTAMAERTAELASEMVEVSEESQVVDVFGRHAHAALRPVGPMRRSGRTEWLAVLIWQERLRQGEIREFGSPEFDYSPVGDPGSAIFDQVDDSRLEITDTALSGHLGAVLCETYHGRLPRWERITDALITHGLENYGH